jgi:glycine/D-amino acid oxidase-like deaminating enzyme
VASLLFFCPALRWKNITLATGHNSTGIILSAITGQAIAEYVTAGHIPTIMRPFSRERFSRY